jgi:hypothetical protein
MTASRDLLQKADMTIANLVANGGMLQPEDSAVFLRKLIKEPTILRQARVVEMLAPQRKINKIGFGQRILRAGTQGVALNQNAQNNLSTGLGGRAMPTTETIQLTTSEVIAQVNLPYDVLEDNIERALTADNAPPNARGPGGLKETILALMAERAALDLEELCLLGDVSYTDSADLDDQAYLSMLDGWIKLATVGGVTVGGSYNGESHVYNINNAGMDKSIFREMKKLLPKQYLRVLPQMNFITSTNAETMWRDSLANRGTALGDATLTGTSPVPAYGIAVQGSPMMPDTTVLLSNPKNLIIGIQRNFSMEFDKDITTRTYIIVLTARIAVAVEETDATVLGQNLNVNA